MLPARAQTAAPGAPLLEFRNVTVDHGAFRALHSISLEIRAGEHTAIVGPNGSGKSTLLKVLMRELYPRLLDPPPVVRVLGRADWALFDLRNVLGIVTNDLVEQCTRPITVRETVLSGFFGSIGLWPNHVVTPQMECKAADLMDLLQLTELAERELTAMSSGELRRAVVARALVHDPLALALDEPSNSLDVRAQRDLRATLQRLARSGITIVLVTHHLPDIVPEVNRVVCLKAGRIHADGPKREILRPAVLSALFGTPVDVIESHGYFHLR
jgi:iron complex transport system ATP-binding protein